MRPFKNKLLTHEISINNIISIDQLAKKLTVTRRTIIRDIEKLKKQNKLIRIGPDKGGYWEVNEK